jgi:hypothetical protein
VSFFLKRKKRHRGQRLGCKAGAHLFEGVTQFKYKTDGGMPTLRATLTAGRSIFWKKI